MNPFHDGLQDLEESDGDDDVIGNSPTLARGTTNNKSKTLIIKALKSSFLIYLPHKYPKSLMLPLLLLSILLILRTQSLHGI
jgi:hypothetical protein